MEEATLDTQREAAIAPRIAGTCLLRSLDIGLMYAGAALQLRILLAVGYPQLVAGILPADGSFLSELPEWHGGFVWLLGLAAPYLIAIVAIPIAARCPLDLRARGRVPAIVAGIALGVVLIVLALFGDLAPSDLVSLAPILALYWAPALLLCIGGTLLTWNLMRRSAVPGIAACASLFTAVACVYTVFSADSSLAGAILWFAETLDVVIMTAIVTLAAFVATLRRG